MTKIPKSEAATLRRKAVELINQKKSKSGLRLPKNEAELFKIIYELEVHQIELEMQNAELALAKEQAEGAAKKYIELYDFAPSGNFTVTSSGEIIELNPIGAKMLGKERSHLRNSQFGIFISVDTRSIFNQFLKKIFISNVQESCDVTLFDDSNLPVYLHLTGIAAENGVCLITMVDMTEHMKTEKLMNLAKFSSDNPFPIMRISQNGTLLYVNEAGMKQLPDWILKTGQPVTNILHDVVSNTLSLGEVQVEEFEHFGKIYTFYVKPYVEEGYVNLYGWDITERKQAEEKLKESEFRFQQISENAQELIWEVDINGLFTYASPVIKGLLGYEPEEIIGKKHFYDLFDHENREELKQAAFGIFDRKECYKDFVNINLHKDGRKIIVSTSGIPMLDNLGNLIGYRGVDIDITDFKRAQESLRESEYELRILAESMPQMVWITRPDGWNIYFNQQWLDYTGQTLAESHGHGWNKPFHPDDKQRAWDAWQNATKNNTEYSIESRLRRADGVYHWFLVRGVPFQDEHGTILKWFGTCTDIDELKRSQEEFIIAKEHAEESDRLKSAFLANMSHEVRTPLNSIIGFSELLVDPDFNGDQKDEFIQHIISSGNNLLSIISDIMDISKLESGEITIHNSPINIYNFIGNMIERFFFLTQRTNVELKLIVPENSEETLIFADTERLNQIFNNLISNAFKFTSKGQIEIGYQKKGKMVEFFVKDSGIGIPAEYHTKIFDRFRQVDNSASRKFGGNGLGLAISKKLIELMGGEIWVVSEVGKGSAFYFTLQGYYSEM